MIDEDTQRAVCNHWRASYLATNPDDKVGISKDLISGGPPINGMRHYPTLDTSGWYIWAGEEFSEHDDFFDPLHAKHLSECCPEVERFLGLSPGWRFLIAPGYEDVWFDEGLLKV